MALAPCCSSVIAGETREFRKRETLGRLAAGLEKPFCFSKLARFQRRADRRVWVCGGRRVSGN